MRHRTLRLLAVFFFFVISAGAPLAHSWELDDTVMAVDIPFSFHAADQMFAPGSYQVEIKGFRVHSLVFRSRKGLAITGLPVISRLRSPDTTTQDSHTYVVFDTVGHEMVLSEVWIPDRDGYQVSTRSTPVTERRVVLGSKPS